MRLSETILRYLKSSISNNPEDRMALEVEMRAVNGLLGLIAGQVAETKQSAATLSNAQVIGVKTELGLIVANIGSKQGVKIGMPFKIKRNSKQIGLVRVVDVREKIAGAVIQEIDSAKDKIKVGDHLEVEVHQ